MSRTVQLWQLLLVQPWGRVHVALVFVSFHLVSASAQPIVGQEPVWPSDGDVRCAIRSLFVSGTSVIKRTGVQLSCFMHVLLTVMVSQK